MTDAAVEAAAKALHRSADSRSQPGFRVAWKDCLPAYREMLLSDARAAIEAALPHLQDGLAVPGWRDIESYPRCENCDRPDCDWGPETLLLVQYKHGSFPFVGHKEAGEWLVRDADDPISWSGLTAIPTKWAPLPPAPPLVEV